MAARASEIILPPTAKPSFLPVLRGGSIGGCRKGSERQRESELQTAFERTLRNLAK